MGKGDNRKSHKETKKQKQNKKAKPINNPLPANPDQST